MDQKVEQLHSQAESFLAKFWQEGKVNYIDKAIALDREALALCPPEHLRRSVSLTCLGVHLCTRYDQLGSVEDIEEAIVLDREALVFRPLGHADRSVSLNCLAHHLWTRYKRLGSMEHLDEAIVLDRDALVLCSPGHPDRSKSLNNLAIHLCTRYDGLGSVDDLNEAIILDRDALALRPEEHPDRSASLHSLSRDLVRHFDISGSIESLNEAIVLTKDALALRPPGHPDRSKSLNNLAVYLCIRHDHVASAEDLNEAILLFRDALTLRPPGHPDRSMTLSNLAVRLYGRYGQLGSVEDLNEAIVLDRDALALRPLGNPHRSMSLGNLALHLYARYKQLGSVEDLNEAIALDRDALVLRPVGHPRRSLSLNNLASSLAARYEQLGSVADLNEAIVLKRDALAFCSPRSRYYSTFLNNLAVHLRMRYNLLGSIEDLDEAITLGQDALALCPPGHPVRSQALSRLAQHLSVRLSQSKDREELFGLYIQLAHASPVESSADLSAAKAWIRAAEDIQHPTTLLAYKTSLRFLTHHTATLPSLPQHLTVLRRLTSSLAVDAFSACLRNHSLTDAVELLEQGRGVFWAQLTRLHSPIDDVTDSGPEGKTVAEDFTRLTSLLRKVLDSPGQDQHDRMCNLNVQLEKVVAKIRNLPGFERFLLPPLFSDLRSAASQGPIIIVNSSEHGCDALIVLLDQDPIHVPLSVTKEEVRELSLRLRTLIVHSKSLDVKRDLCVFLRQLWDGVVSPIVDSLQLICPPRSRIWWCPTAEFSVLPLHAAGPFRKGQQNLPNLYISSYTPTLTALIRARRHHVPPSPPKLKRLIAIGQANASGENELLSVSTELAQIRQRVDGLATFTCIEGEESSIAQVTRELAGNEWVHFACHGIPNRQRPFESAFALHDGRLTIERIIRCRPEDPQFAYLSACHTTVGDEESPDEVIHLASAMQFAGFRSVIGTMWAVDDAETNKITSMFYDNMKDESSGCLDYTRAAFALNKTTRKLVGIPFDQRILYIHLGA